MPKTPEPKTPEPKTGLPYHPGITAKTVTEHGLSESEYGVAVGLLDGRAPNLLELGIFSVMWSEHCSYKSSKKWLKTLPTEGPQVICGPGENAGVIDIGDGQAAVFKIESHNHPSFIEPYQGAATGVGGILRDVFTMGARPVANLNALRFGPPDHEKTKRLVSGVVAGIGGYGNCMGVPTVAGETGFDAAYQGNILVNAMTVGVADADKIFYSAASGTGNPVVYVGAKTGRDGIHGATMASTEFDDRSEAKRPTVQVGDPFKEKCLLEACLELMATDAILAIQDMGAAGLTSSSFEMASKGESGVELWLDRVPQRETGMTPYEMMLSESQERMLMVIKPGREDQVKAIYDKWDLDFAVVGKITATGRMVLTFDGVTVGDLPIDPLALASPEYDRPWVETKPVLFKSGCEKHPLALASLKRLLGGPHLASRRWIWEQYDHTVMTDTLQRPGGDAAVVRVHGTQKALAMTVDCTPRYVVANPELGGAQAVAEAFRNLSAVGAKPLAITNNLNFGNPEKPEIMGQIVGSLKGMARASRALDLPVVSGNVSLYNETHGVPVLPTPVIGAVGLMKNVKRMASIAVKRENDDLVLLSATPGKPQAIPSGDLSGSLYARDILGHRAAGLGAPALDLAGERTAGDFVRRQIETGAIDTAHDVSDGGVLVSVAEMLMAGNTGAKLEVSLSTEQLFCEDQGMYVVATPDARRLMHVANQAGVGALMLGSTGGGLLSLNGAEISLSSLMRAHENWFPQTFG